MDPPPILRTGFDLGGDHDAAADAMLHHVHALMFAFSEEACNVAARCAIVDGRRKVMARDMRGGLMYCARTFFDKADDDLRARIERALSLLNESDDSEEESTAESDEELDDGGPLDDATASDIALHRHVRTVVEHWHKWQPTDPVHVLVKNAIDCTPCDDESTPEDDPP